MTDAPPDLHQLVFSGEHLPDTSPDEARRALADFFGVDDPQAVAGFFSGKPVTLRRNLPKGDAMRLYRQLRSAGLLCDVQPAAAPDAAKSATQDTAPAQEAGAQKAAAKTTVTKTSGTRAAPAAKAPAKKTPPRKVAGKTAPAGRASAGKAPARKAPAKNAPKPAPKTAPKPVPQARPQPRRDAAPPRAPDAAAPPRQPPREESLGPAGPAPNYFALRPALERSDYPAIRGRARSRAQVALVVVLAVAVICGGLLLRFPAADGEAPAGAEAAAAARGQLLLLADNALHLHGRSGRGIMSVEAADLGLATVAPPLWMRDDGSVFVAGKADPTAPMGLWRCDLGTKSCAAALDPTVVEAPAAVTGSTIADTLFLHTRNGELLRIGGDGTVQARSALALPPGHPRLLQDAGLLRVPSAEGPLVGVFRPDAAGFAEQLDALLLLAPAAVEREQEQVRDLVRVADSYWALLGNGRGDTGLYRFDSRWTFVGASTLPDGFGADYLVAWQDKLLVVDRSEIALLRFAADGRAEAPLRSELLEARAAAWRDTHRLGRSARALTVSAAAILAVGALLFAVAQYLYAAHLPASRGSSTALLDPMPGGIHWLPAAARRETQLRRVTLLLPGIPLLAAVALALGGAAVAAALLVPAIAASLAAVRLLWRGRGGHCGLLPERLIVVDYDGRYSYGRRSEQRGDDRFLLLGSVALPLGFRWLGNLQAQPLLQHGGALQGADTLSAPQLFARLLHLRHPWLLALLSITAGWCLSAALLLTLAALR